MNALRTLLVGTLLAMLAACASSRATHGRTGVEATYFGRDLEAVLPADVTVPQAAAAAEATLLATGYVMAERTVVSGRARLVASAPDRSGLPLDRTPVVVIKPVLNGTRTIVTVEPFGDEELSRRILDGMLARLGR